MAEGFECDQAIPVGNGDGGGGEGTDGDGFGQDGEGRRKLFVLMVEGVDESWGRRVQGRELAGTILTFAGYSRLGWVGKDWTGRKNLYHRGH